MKDTMKLSLVIVAWSMLLLVFGIFIGTSYCSLS